MRLHLPSQSTMVKSSIKVERIACKKEPGGMRLFGMSIVFCTVSIECSVRFGNGSGETWE